MPDLTAKRTLVKSPPELWAELSEVEGLSRHLGEFGEIKISRLDPEKTVAWEGEHASGTVEIESSSWGTKVVLTAEISEAAENETEDDGRRQAPGGRRESSPEAEAEAESEVEPETVAGPELTVEPAPEVEPAPNPETRPYQQAPWLNPPPPPEHDLVTEEAEQVFAAEAEATPAPRRRGFFSRWLFRERRGSEAPHPEPESESAPAPTQDYSEPEAEPARETPTQAHFETEPEPEPVEMIEPTSEEPVDAQSSEPAAEAEEAKPRPAINEERVLAVLEGALDNLGSAHHRPFSRG